MTAKGCFGKHSVGPRRNPKKKRPYLVGSSAKWEGSGDYPRKKVTKLSTTGHRCVSFDSGRSKYRVEVKLPDTTRKFIGRFDCLETAKREADIAMERYNPLRYPKEQP